MKTKISIWMNGGRMSMSVSNQTFEEYLEKYARQNKISVDEARKHKIPMSVEKMYNREVERGERGIMYT